MLYQLSGHYKPEKVKSKLKMNNVSAFSKSLGLLWRILWWLLSDFASLNVLAFIQIWVKALNQSLLQKAHLSTFRNYYKQAQFVI